MIFPQLGPEFFSEHDQAMRKRMETFYSEAISINQSFWAQADTDTRFMINDQSLWNDLYGNVPANRRKQFSFNRIRRVVDMVGGYQRRNRKSTIVVPVENGDMETADQFSKILLWINQQEGVYETISDAFHGSLVTGMNLLHVWVDYRKDPVSGNIRVDNCSYNSFLIDPYFKKTDLSDCNALWKRSFLTPRECASLMPDKKDIIAQLQPLDAGGSQDGKFQYMPQSYNYGMKNLLTYDEFYYRDFRKQKLLVDTQTGETQEWSGDEDKLRQFLALYPQITVIDSEIPTVRLAVMVQGKVLYDDVNPLGIDTYPFVPVFAYYTPETPYFEWRIQGMVRGLRDSQYLYNRRRIIELDILESQVTSGYIYKENALVNPKDVFLSGQGRGIALKEDANITDITPIMPPQVPPSMIQLSELLAKEVEQISGVNEELLGSAVDDKAGILSMLRQGAGLTTLQRLFDQLDRSQKLLGKIMIDIIQRNFTPGKVKRITEQEPTQQFYNKSFGTYDAAVEEGMNTSTQRQMQFAQLLHLREVGVPIPDTQLIEAATLQNKKQLIDAIEQSNKQKQQLEQMQAQVAMQEQQARIQLAQARATADRGLGVERMSRIEENKALAQERRSEAAKDQMSGVLDLVRALKEIESVDLDNLYKLISLASSFKDPMVGLSTQKNIQSAEEITRGIEQGIGTTGESENTPEL